MNFSYAFCYDDGGMLNYIIAMNDEIKRSIFYAQLRFQSILSEMCL